MSDNIEIEEKLKGNEQSRMCAQLEIEREREKGEEKGGWRTTRKGETNRECICSGDGNKMEIDTYGCGNNCGGNDARQRRHLRRTATNYAKMNIHIGQLGY